MAQPPQATLPPPQTTVTPPQSQSQTTLPLLQPQPLPAQQETASQSPSGLMAQPQASLPPPQPQSQSQPRSAQPGTSAQSTDGISEQLSYKNHLQEYTQRANIPLPQYLIKNEGSQHDPMYRATVTVDGLSCTSPNTFSHRKTAEQDVARIVLLTVQQKIKAEQYPVIREETSFCKCILNDFASKTKLEKPTYTTHQSKGLPVFISSLVFNGKRYVGTKGRNKKEAERLAARAVILSILDSESGTVISDIIRSKNKLYVAMDKDKNSCNTQNGTVPVEIQPGHKLGTAASNGNEFEVAEVTNNMPRNAIPERCSGVSTNVLAANRPLHVFIPRTSEPAFPSEAITTSIVFVPPTSEQLLVDSTSVKKRKRKPKKAKNKVGVDIQLHVDAVSTSQPSPCSVAQ